MKMKSKLFGFSAKMALAAVAVCGMLTSCYEKEEIDNTGSTQLPDPVYVLYGNVTNAQTGEAIANASVSIDGTAVAADANGYFVKTDLTGGKAYTVVVDMDGYLKATRTVYMQTVNKGETCIVVADIALYDAASQAAEPEINTPATKEQSTVMMNAAKAQVTELLGSVQGLDAENIAISVDENGNTVVKAGVEVTAAVGENVTVAVPSFTGFASTITPETTFTKALTEAQIWVASAERALNRSYGLSLISVNKVLEGQVGKSINGYTLTITMENRALQFNGREGYATYQASAVVAPTYESHDSHDSHNTHGSDPNAGGGDGNSQGY